jgi:hypothetical protein
MTDSISFYIVGVIYIAILFVLVRPSSKGPQLIATMSTAFADLVRGVAGQTYDINTNTWSTGG